MNVKEITSGIHYVGVNDRTIARFEAMWTLPYGVSYNSYLVCAEKCALIDSVELDTFAGLASHLDSELGHREIDYLVVNHMEPDHSGSIPVLLERYPKMRIVCNKLSAAQIKGFYHVEDDTRFLVMADGDTLDLGGLSLKFIFTPMVHWPETMMTYCPERKVLFSGDAFGCFGALNGIVTDEGMDEKLFEVYSGEMYRYYSCIVAKYGKFVQSAMHKTSDFQIDYICSTHGPVWHERKQQVAGIYDTLSSWTPEKGIVLVFGTMYGNTSRLVDMICRALAAHGRTDIRVHNAATADLSHMITDCVRYETLIIGSPTYSMDIFPPVASLVRALQTREVRNKSIGVFSSFTWANGALAKLTEAFDAIGNPPVASLAMKQAPHPDMEREVDEFVTTLLNL